MQKFFIIFLLYILFLAQLSFFVHFPLKNQTPNFILILLLLFIFFGKPEENFSFCIAAFGGVFSDLFFSPFLGIQTLIFLLLTFLLKQVIKILHRLNFFWILGFFIFSLIFTNVLFYFINNALLNITSFSFSWGEILNTPQMLYNTTLGILFFYLFLFIRKYVLETKRIF